MKVLLIEDNEDLRGITQKIFEDEGHQVLSAGDGEQALQICATEPIDIIILDWFMPKMGGEEFLIRRLLIPTSIGRPPVVVLSAISDTLPIKPEWCVVEVMRKPVDPEHLLKRVAEIGKAS